MSNKSVSIELISPNEFAYRGARIDIESRVYDGHFVASEVYYSAYIDTDSGFKCLEEVTTLEDVIKLIDDFLDQ